MPKPEPQETRPAPDQSVAVVVNRRAGTVLEMGAERFQALIEREFAHHGYRADVVSVDGDKLEQTLRRALAGPHHLVLLAGGDGTLSLMLPWLMRAQVPVGLLPLGTLNLFGADIGLSTDISDSIARIAHGIQMKVDIAHLNGVPFHSISGVGYAAMMAREREKARRVIPFSKALSFLWAALRTLVFSKPITVEIVAEGTRRIHEADGVLITNNRFDGLPWRRGTLDDGLLEVHTFKANGLWGRLRALMAVARGQWREIETLETTTTPELILRRRGKRRIVVATDGEIKLMRGDLHYTIAPGALTMTVARPEPEA